MLRRKLSCGRTSCTNKSDGRTQFSIFSVEKELMFRILWFIVFHVAVSAHQNFEFPLLEFQIKRHHLTPWLFYNEPGKDV